MSVLCDNWKIKEIKETKFICIIMFGKNIYMESKRECLKGMKESKYIVIKRVMK